MVDVAMGDQEMGVEIGDHAAQDTEVMPAPDCVARQRMAILPDDDAIALPDDALNELRRGTQRNDTTDSRSGANGVLVHDIS
jgi:hypothetical protein